MKRENRAPGRAAAPAALADASTAAPDRSPAGVALHALGATLAWSAGAGSFEGLRPRLERMNFRGRTTSLRGGVGAAAGAVAASARIDRAVPGSEAVAVAALVATTTAGVAGLADERVEGDAGAHDGGAPVKGLTGHLGALARGRVTTGALKVVVIGSGALVSGVLLARYRNRSLLGPVAGARGPLAVAVDAATGAAVIAAWANVHNLLDLRPGRALKTAALLSGSLLIDRRRDAGASRALAAGALGIVAAALPEDLLEDTMLGDTGANAVGALVGTALAAHPGRAVRGLAALVGTGLVLVSERVSFTRVIAGTPVLAALDGLGRRPS
ncbi:hypothetical protein [Actinomyces gerencseriae]